jgi:anaphase-promoting complex subunit 11
MKVEINEWHAVATWTWGAEDDACGICRFASPHHALLHLLLE